MLLSTQIAEFFVHQHIGLGQIINMLNEMSINFHEEVFSHQFNTQSFKLLDKIQSIRL